MGNEPIRPFKNFPGVFTQGGGDRHLLLTRNLLPGMDKIADKIVHGRDGEYRSWNPYRSKLAAALEKGLRRFPLEETSVVLYLGASSGTTVSHVSDVVTGGKIYAVEFSARTMRELVQNCQSRFNIFPVLADANRPESYRYFLPQPVDVLYQDVAQPNQAEILVKNARWYLKPGGIALLAIKTRSIDTTEAPAKVIKREKRELNRGGFQLVEEVNIDPYAKDHAFLACTYAG